MKAQSIITSAALTALLALANAHASGFTPIEELAPEQRQQVSAKIDEATQNMDIDWDNIVAGVSDAGDIMLIDKTNANVQMIAMPSCFGVR